MEATVYKNIQQGINLLTINITKWETKNKVVNNTSQIPEIICREAREICGRSIGDPLFGVHQFIGEDHP